jgi:hypothetical protein
MNLPSGLKPFCENVEYLTFTERKSVRYQGHCKIYVNETLQQLILVPAEEEVKVISASFKWNFVVEENILLVESPGDVLNFVMVFDTPLMARKVFHVVTKNLFVHVLNQQRIFKQKFFLPFMHELNNPKETEIVSKFLGFCSDQKKRVFMDIMINKRLPYTETVVRNQPYVLTSFFAGYFMLIFFCSSEFYQHLFVEKEYILVIQY